MQERLAGKRSASSSPVVPLPREATSASVMPRECSLATLIKNMAPWIVAATGKIIEQVDASTDGFGGGHSRGTVHAHQDSEDVADFDKIPFF